MNRLFQLQSFKHLASGPHRLAALDEIDKELADWFWNSHLGVFEVQLSHEVCVREPWKERVNEIVDDPRIGRGSLVPHTFLLRRSNLTPGE